MSSEEDAGERRLHAGIAFEWHERKAVLNLRKHGVSFDEASTVFADDQLLTVPDRLHSEQETRYLAVGLSDRGRILTVCFTERGERVRLISARISETWERREYEADKQ